MDSKKFHIAFCSDEGFIPHTATAIHSLCQTTNDTKRLHIWLLDAGITLESCLLISSMISKFEVSFDIIKVPIKNDDTLHADRHVSRATYGRLLLPELIDESIRTCLYLDSDLVANEDILKLADSSFKNKALAVVDDFYLNRNKELSVPESHRYFNAGVVLMNLENWRKRAVVEKVFYYAKRNPEDLLYWDQDAMNAVLCDKRASLPLRWNHQVHFDDYLYNLPDGSKASEMKEAMTNPAIIHFVGPEKPWHYLCLHPYKDLYLKYRERTPWGGVKLPAPEDLPTFFHGKRMVIFGAGKTGKVTIRQYRQYGCNPEYVLDNDQLKIGRTINGLPIRSPSYLSKEELDSMVIVIASMFRNEIKVQLETMGLEEFRHFVVRGFEPNLQLNDTQNDQGYHAITG